jgi:hypothetical protein
MAPATSHRRDRSCRSWASYGAWSRRTPTAAARKAPATVERDELLRQFQQKVAADFAPLTEAAAKGVHHLMAKDRDGTWTEVTDPRTLAKVLNSGETCYRIYARNSDVKALKDLFDGLFGTPTKQVEMTLHGELDLVERLARARQRGKRWTPLSVGGSRRG